MDYEKHIKDLREKEKKLIYDIDQMLDKARQENRNLDDSEMATFDNANIELESVQRQREIYQKQAERHDYLESAEPVQSRPETRDERKASDDTITYRDGYGKEIKLIPGSEQYRLATSEYEYAFRHYMTTGRLAQRGVELTTGADGGFFVPPQIASRVVERLTELVYMRRLAATETLLQGTELLVPVSATAIDDGEWTAEIPNSDFSADTLNLTQPKLALNQLAKMTEISALFMTQAPESELNRALDRLARGIARTEEKAFIIGDGNDKPEGIFVDSNINTVNSGSDTGIASTAIHAAFEDLRDVYLNNATWIGSSKFFSEIRRLDAASDRGSLFQYNLSDPMPERLLGRPIVISEFVNSDYGTVGNDAAILGDISRCYMIADAQNTAMLRNQNAKRGKIEVSMFRWTDGKTVLPEAATKIIIGANA